MKSNSYIRDFFICVVVMLILGAIMSSYCYRQGSKKGFIYGVEYVRMYPLGIRAGSTEE